MSATHTLEAVAASGDVERKVLGNERVVLRSGKSAEAWKVDQLSAFRLEHAERRFFIVSDSGHGRYLALPPGGRIELGADAFSLADLSVFELCEIPKPKPEPPATSKPGPWRMKFVDPDRPPIVLELAGAQVQGERLDGPAWEPRELWGVRLDDLAT